MHFLSILFYHLIKPLFQYYGETILMASSVNEKQDPAAECVRGQMLPRAHQLCGAARRCEASALYFFYLLFQCFQGHLAEQYSAFLPIPGCLSWQSRSSGSSPGREVERCLPPVFPKALRAGNNLPILFFFFFFPDISTNFYPQEKKSCVFIMACFPHYLQRSR